MGLDARSQGPDLELGRGGLDPKHTCATWAQGSEQDKEGKKKRRVRSLRNAAYEGSPCRLVFERASFVTDTFGRPGE